MTPIRIWLAVLGLSKPRQDVPYLVAWHAIVPFLLALGVFDLFTGPLDLRQLWLALALSVWFLCSELWERSQKWERGDDE